MSAGLVTVLGCAAYVAALCVAAFRRQRRYARMRLELRLKMSGQDFSRGAQRPAGGADRRKRVGQEGLGGVQVEASAESDVRPGLVAALGRLWRFFRRLCRVRPRECELDRMLDDWPGNPGDDNERRRA